MPRKLDYQSRLVLHLEDYKRSVLGIEENGTWRKAERQHILPWELRKQNVLPSIREAFWSSFTQHDQLQMFFHHLNSSQAMAFNLFFRAKARADDGALLRALEIGDQFDKFEFEHVPEPAEKTNLDVFIRSRLPSGKQRRVLIEVKLSEQHFGPVGKIEERHFRKLEALYRPKLRGSVHENCLAPDFFFKHYQLLRNIYHLEPRTDDRLILLFPEANEKLRYVHEWLDKNVQPEVRAQIQTIHLESLVRNASKEDDDDLFWQEFTRKYIPGLAG